MNKKENNISNSKYIKEKGVGGGRGRPPVEGWKPAWVDTSYLPGFEESENQISVTNPEPTSPPPTEPYATPVTEEPPQSPAIELSVPVSMQIPSELESLLKAILEGVLVRTDDPEIIQSAKNLLDICRDQFREGKPDVAWGNARYLQKQIPDYLTQRRIR